MVPVALSDVIAVGEVPTADEVQILAKAGFRSILNAQPDGEVARFLSAAEAKALTEGAGLSYSHVPIPSRRPNETELAAFAAALNALPRPIYACCYSGARATAAWALAAAPHHEPDAIVAACRDAGYDVEFLRAKLSARRAGATTPATTTTAPSATGTSAATFVAQATIASAPASAPAAAPASALPLIQPSVLAPRAASAGGFATAG